MLPEQQQRIMGYFIEEAKDHLDTIEQGLLNLQATIENSEEANEIFRAAHSVKGGAAMLGLESIQRTAHCLEDYFKVLKESTIQVDRTLETMFLWISDGLKELIEQLETPSGLTPEKAQAIMADIDPVFRQLDSHLEGLVADDQDGIRLTDSVRHYSLADEEALQVSFRQDVAALLRQMLTLFKQPDLPESRQDLQTVCSLLTALGERFGLSGWCDLLKTAGLATTNLENAYRTLAPILIREIKHAQDLVLSGHESEIVVSETMRSLLPKDIVGTRAADDLLSDFEQSPEVSLQMTAESQDEDFALSSELSAELPIDQLSDGNQFNGSVNSFESLSTTEADTTEGSDIEADIAGASGLEIDAVVNDIDITDSNFEIDESDADELDSFNRTSQDLDFDEVPSELSMLDLNSGSEEADESLSALFTTEATTENSVEPEDSTEALEDFADLFEDEEEGLDDTPKSHGLRPEEAQLSPENLDQREQDDITEPLTEVSLGEASSSAWVEDNFAVGDLFEEAFCETSETSKTSGSGDGAAHSKSLSETSNLAAFDQAPLTAEEIAEGITSSETLSLGFFSNQPISPSEEEIEFPTLTGVKLNEAKKDIDSFFSESDNRALADLFEDTPDWLTQSSRSEGYVEGYDDLLLDDFEIDSATTDEADTKASNTAAELEDDLDITAEEASDAVNAQMENIQLSDSPWNELAFEDSLIADTADSDDEPVDSEQKEVSSSSASSPAQSVADQPVADDIANRQAIEDSTLNFDELLPEDLLEFEEAFGEESTETTEDDSTAQNTQADYQLEDLFEESGKADRSENSVSDDFLEDIFSAEAPSMSEDPSDDGVSVGESASAATRSEEADKTGMSADSNQGGGSPIDDLLESNSLEARQEQNIDSQKESQPLELNDSDNSESPANESSISSILESDNSSDVVESDSEAEDFEDKDFGDLEQLLSEDGEGKQRSPASSRLPASSVFQRTLSTPKQNMRVPVKQLDNLSNLVGELVVNRNTLEKEQARTRQFLDNLMSQVQQMNDVGQQMRDLYERSLLESSLVASRKSYAAATSRTAPETEDHATGATFDALEMDRFTGFHTLSQEMIELIVRVRESASDLGYTVESTDQVTRQFRQVTTELQEGLNTARMVPFSNALARLPRAIREISLKCGKEATLVVEGENTLIDKMVVESLYDPLTHLVNNAITHGIEAPEQRVAAGKPPEGKIEIRALYQGNQTLIYISDDGSGIDPDFVKRKAIEKKLITQAEAEELSSIEACRLIFQPGFSTKDHADNFAGRGVGMDVVQTALARIHGIISIDSELGKGTTFTIRLPLTLSISKALSCVSNQARIALPMDGVEDMLDIGRDRLVKNEAGEDCIRWRESLLPVCPVSDLLRFNRKISRAQVYDGRQSDEVMSIIVLRSADTLIAIQVDQVLGEEEIVFKQLEGPVPKPIGIAGATVMGDGRVMPVADVLELTDIATGRIRRESVSLLGSNSDETAEAAKGAPTVLIVDDSITVRELLSISFSKVGYRVEQARDGKEAWTKLQSGLPCDLVFCDIEMPRMDGLTLLSRIRKDSVLNQIPVAILTSRGADRHRQLALDLGADDYFTKPYLEEALLEAAQQMLTGEAQTKGRGS